MSYPTKPVELPYQTEFGPTDFGAAHDCLKEHGFAIVKQLMPRDLVAELQRAVVEICDPEGSMAANTSRTILNFVERHPAALKMIECQPLMAWHEHLMGTKDLTVHRSACILRKPGCPPVGWHTDHSFDHTPPKNTNDALNNHDWPNGKWFYLTGSYPEHGGIAVIADSHRDDWQGPEGFNFVDPVTKKSFYRRGSESGWYNKFDVPGCVPLFTEPGDMILFASKTYHGAFENYSDQTRLSCAIGFRPRAPHNVPWDLPDDARAFVERVPSHLKPYFEHYTSIVPGWTPVAV